MVWPHDISVSIPKYIEAEYFFVMLSLTKNNYSIYLNDLD